MSPFLTICLVSYSFGLAIAVIHFYYGPLAAINFLAMAGLFDVS